MSTSMVFSDSVVRRENITNDCLQRALLGFNEEESDESALQRLSDLDDYLKLYQQRMVSESAVAVENLLFEQEHGMSKLEFEEKSKQLVWPEIPDSTLEQTATIENDLTSPSILQKCVSDVCDKRDIVSDNYDDDDCCIIDEIENKSSTSLVENELEVDEGNKQQAIALSENCDEHIGDEKAADIFEDSICVSPVLKTKTTKSSVKRKRSDNESQPKKRTSTKKRRQPTKKDLAEEIKYLEQFIESLFASNIE